LKEKVELNTLRSNNSTLLKWYSRSTSCNKNFFSISRSPHLGNPERSCTSVIQSGQVTMQVDHGLEALMRVLVSADVHSGVACAAAFNLIQVSATSHKCFNHLVLMFCWRIANV